MKPTEVIRKAHLLGLRFARRLCKAGRDELKCWGFRWNPIANAWVATRTRNREAVVALMESGNYPL